jgi:DNA-binding transcriptional MocR family regulator
VRPRIATAPPAPAQRLRGVMSSPVREILALTQQPGVISFAGGLPAPELFDAEGLRAAFAHVLSDAAAGRTLQYSTTEGDPALRAAIAARLAARGLPTDGDELLVTSGSQQALTLVAAALVEPGDAILVEDPSYLAAIQAFQLAGARIIPVPCDDDGLDPDAVAALVRREQPKLLYTVPTFHNPTGRTLPADRRAALAGIAARQGLWIVEDDPYGELRYRGAASRPIAAHPEAEDRTIALSTLSKVLAPGLRIGWLRAPVGLRRSLAVAKQAADLHSSTVDQAAAARWLTTCDLDAHVEGLRRAYGPRRDALVEGLADVLPEGSRWTRPDGGMFVWVRLPSHWDAEALLPHALERQVAFVPGWPFYAGHPDRATLRLSFTAHTAQEIAEGLRRLRAAVDAAGGAAL